MARGGGVRAYTLLTLAASLVIDGGLVAPLEFHQIRHAAYMTHWLRDTQPGHVLRLLSMVRDVPIHLFGQPYGSTLWAAGWWVLFLMPPVLIWRGRRDLLLPTLLAFGTILVPFGVDLTKGTLASTQQRYVILATLPMCLIIVGMLRRPVFANALPAAIALFSALSLFTFYSEPINEDWKQITELIVRDIKKGEPIVYACMPRDDPEALPQTVYLCASRYVPKGHPVYLTNRPLREDESKLLGKTAWVVIGWQITNADAVIPGATSLETKLYYPTAVVAHVRMPNPGPGAK